MRASRYPLWTFILGGFLAAGRQFAYLGVSPLFIGEAYLGWNIVRNRGNWLGRFVDDILQGEILAVAIAVNLLWGLVEVFRCLYLNKSPIEVLRIFALSYYPIYLLVGMSIGRELTIAQFVRAWKIMILIYIPYTIVGNYGYQAGFDIGYPCILPIMPLVMIALWPYLRDWWPRHLALLGTCYPLFFASGHNRGSMLGLLAGMAMLIVVSRANLGRWIAGVLAVLLLLFVVGPYIPGPPGQAPPLDPVVQIARITGTFSPHLAEKMLDERGYHEEAANIEGAEGTTEWRKTIWRNAIRSLNTTTLMIVGQGGGASMQSLVPDGQDIHTPHNFTIFCLYYLGAVGLAAYIFLLVALFLVCRRIENPAFGALSTSVILATIMLALVGDCFETPFGAIPFFLVCGTTLGIGQALAARSISARTAQYSATSTRARRAVRARPNMPFAAARPST